jgi:hypothetical protein
VRGSVTDVFIPRWFAANLPAMHVPLVALATYLHATNLVVADKATELSTADLP